jgi:hypothetical protein
LPKFSEFYQKVIGRCQNFCIAEVPKGVLKKGAAAGVDRLLGRKALEYHFNRFDAQVRKGCNLPTASDAKIFKTFAFMLNGKEFEESKGWIQQCAKDEIRAGQLALKNTKDGVGAPPPSASSGKGLEIVRSSSCALLPKPPAKVAKKLVQKVDDKADKVQACKQDLLKYFITTKPMGK